MESLRCLRAISIWQLHQGCSVAVIAMCTLYSAYVVNFSYFCSVRSAVNSHLSEMASASSKQAKTQVMPVIQQNDPVRYWVLQLGFLTRNLAHVLGGLAAEL